MSGQSGKGNSSAETKQTANNYQVATQSGIAVGGQGNSANINVSTADPEVAKTAIQGNAYVSSQALLANTHTTDSALNFAGHAADVAASVNEYATGAIKDVASLSIVSGNDLSTKFLGAVNDTTAKNINLLQSVGQQESDTAINAQKLASEALQSSFSIAGNAAPQSAGAVAENLSAITSKTFLYIAAAVGAILLFITLRKK